MEAVALMIVCTRYLGSLVARKCADDAAEALLERVKDAFRRDQQTELTASTPTDEILAGLQADPGLAPLLQTFFQESTALQRAAGASAAFSGAEILWCDDLPDNNEWERRLFEALGARVTAVRSSRDAVRESRHRSFDVVLSDIDRGGQPLGLGLPAELAAVRAAPVVYYVGWRDPSRGVPPGAHGITSRPDELLHLVCDVLGRGKLS